jgi:UDP-N-acetylmuramate dehydrogenase
LEAEIEIRQGDPRTIQEKVDEIIALRRKKLPPDDWWTAGSYFKNIKDEYGNPTAAAMYLDAIGSKQISVGDAAVFQGHANIFYNKGNATAADLLQLEDILKKRVYEKFGVQLEREVMYVE